MRIRIALGIAAASLLVAACTQEQSPTVAAPDPGSAASTAKTGAPGPDVAQHPSFKHPVPPAVQTTNVGTVISSTDSGGYTYLEVEFGGRRIWMASNRVSVVKGEQIGWGTFALMRDFYSKTLDRTFPEIFFVSTVRPINEAPAPVKEGRILSVTNAAGYSYIQVTVADDSLWLAAPQTQLQQGDTVTWNGGAEMRNFASRSLDRSFDSIWFVDSVTKIN